jgi:ElaB/YqjD/DUF883 family membrane-anchored ribosome-binding protein
MAGGEGAPEGLPPIQPEGDGHDRVGAEARELVDRARERVPQALSEANDAFVAFVREQPLVALGAAVGVGYVLGRMFRRVA